MRLTRKQYLTLKKKDSQKSFHVAYAMQYEQPLHQVGIEPVASVVQGIHLNRFTIEFIRIIYYYGFRPNKA